jgi:hypothetical protein
VLILKGLSDPYKVGGLPVFEQPDDQGVLGDVFQSATPHLTNSPGPNRFVKQPFGKIEDTRSELCVPVHVSSRVIGYTDLEIMRGHGGSNPGKFESYCPGIPPYGWNRSKSAGLCQIRKAGSRKS